jgi:hypothetical protein
MAHFAKLNDSNVVISCEVVADADTKDENGNEVESVGVAFLTSVHGYTNWKKYSRNTMAGKYYNVDSNGNWTSEGDQSKAFRKNPAAIGYTYDPGRDAFIPPKLFDSFILNETTCTWDAPVAYPTVTSHDGLMYLIEWDETNLRWIAEAENKKWNPETFAWIDI